jgi:hypothetical protein
MMKKKEKEKRVKFSARQSEGDKKQHCLSSHIAASIASLGSRKNPEPEEKPQEPQGSQEICCWRESC